ncbi:histone deacetylase 1/2 [Vigna unguiculata]|uniref:Histone deacetylase 1/2 n=1 Tax=Vigna unguiculata TaxID=3917 RepID=A0A4D6MG86_VIGUN|nr:histone deacetylase 1/2 [Vigna unguiculata]
MRCCDSRQQLDWVKYAVSQNWNSNALLEQLSRLPHARSVPFQTTPSIIQVPEEEEEHMDIRPKRRIWSGEDFDSDNDDDMASSKNSVLTAQTSLKPLSHF